MIYDFLYEIFNFHLRQILILFKKISAFLYK